MDWGERIEPWGIQDFLGFLILRRDLIFRGLIAVDIRNRACIFRDKIGSGVEGISFGFRVVVEYPGKRCLWPELDSAS